MIAAITVALVLLLGGLTSVASAATVTTLYDTTAAGEFGVYAGSGGVDGHQTKTITDYGDGFSAALSLVGHAAFVGPLTPSSTNNYPCANTVECSVGWSMYLTGFTLADGAFDIKFDNLTKGLSVNYDP